MAGQQPRKKLDSPVSVVYQRRVDDASFEQYSALQAKTAAVLADWPGFLEQDVVPPSPPVQDDWVVVQRFDSVDAARSWLDSDARSGLLAEVEHAFIGSEDVHLLTGDQTRSQPASSVLISCRVMREDESDFMDWQRRISAAESKFTGFRGHKVERPKPGLSDEWTVALSFDTEENLDEWMNSAERAELLAQGARFNQDLRIRKASYGFDFWIRGRGDNQIPDVPIARANLLVLLVLYPLVVGFNHFISAPLIEAHGVPIAVAVFIGNIATTQILGWWAVPAIFKAFGWWIEPDISARSRNLGYAVIVALLAISVGICALLYTIPTT